MMIRIGYGYDLHRLVEGRPCILGGLEIPSDRGLLGHSDADVLLHAITDALLGSLALGDIGTHFPDSDPQWQGRESSHFLRAAGELVSDRGWSVINLDATVIAEEPRLNPHIDRICRHIAVLLGLAPDQVSVKATTSEGVGAIGRGEAVAVHAVVLVGRNP